jgi:isopentenyl-diphosphate delta-isomerase
MTTTSDRELVVLLDDNGQEVGTAAKASVHHGATPLHLGFSCYLFDARGRVLVTRRALGKPTWPGVWTNSYCGHPSPGEQVVAAVRRRGFQELGLTVDVPVCFLPEFRYRAVATDGTVENEICPVFCARTDGALRVDPDEVMDFAWVSWDDLRSVAQLPWAISPWAAAQIPELDSAGVTSYTGRVPSSSGNSARPNR